MVFSWFRKKKVNPKSELKRVLGTFKLPSFPAVVTRILEKLRDPNASAADLAKIISADPGLSVKVIRVVNSAAFSPLRKVENLQQAVALMGMSSLESLVLSASVGKVVPGAARNAYDGEAFWQASARRAMVARHLAAILHPATVMESFTAGLLQNMAVPYFAKQMPEEYGPIIEAWNQGNGDLAELEREKFDWDHAEVATWLCSQWGLPESLAAAIGEHHGTMDLGGQCPPAVRLAAHIRDDHEHSGAEQLISAVHCEFSVPEARLGELVATGFGEAAELAKLMH